MSNSSQFDLTAKLPLVRDYNPRQPMVLRGSTRVSQQEFLSTVMRLAAVLPDANYIINLCKDRYYFALLFCAAVVKGSTNLLPPNRQPSVINELLDDYKDSICVVDPQEDIVIDGAINIAELLFSDVAVPEHEVPYIFADFVAAIAFTSGSTGKPTPNKKCWKTLSGTASLLSQRFVADGTSPVIVATVPSQHMYGLEMTLMMALYGGAVMSSSHPFFPQDIADVLETIPPERRLLVTTPVHMRAIVKSGIQMPSVMKIVSATAPLNNELAVKAEKLMQTCVEEIYGCTEAGSMATRKTVSEDYWTLLDGMSMEATSNGIVVSGPQLDGKRTLADNLDYLGNGRFRFLGRSADMINVGGKRASLADLTQKLLSIESVDDAVVFTAGDDGEATRTAALVVSSRDERAILAELESKIDSVFLPRPLKKVSVIPRNETGKPTLVALRDVLKNG